MGLGWVHCPKHHFQNKELTPILSSRSGAVFSSSSPRRFLLLDTRVVAGTCLGTSLSATGVTGGTKSCSWELQGQGGAQAEPFSLSQAEGTVWFEQSLIAMEHRLPTV